MKVETRITKILNGAGSTQLKVLKLQNLALKLLGGSPNQKLVIETYKRLHKEVK